MNVPIGQAVKLNANHLGDECQNRLIETLGEYGIVTGKLCGFFNNKYRIQSLTYNTELWLNESVIELIVNHPHMAQYDYEL